MSYLVADLVKPYMRLRSVKTEQTEARYVCIHETRRIRLHKHRF